MADFLIVVKPDPIIVCAAIKLTSGLIIPSARHYDPLMRKIIIAVGGNSCTIHDPREQGFIDQLGTFYNRKDAMEIAVKNNQIRRPEVPKPLGHLFSEHLY